MRSVIEAILERGERISPTKGGAIELTGILFELKNPRARLSRTETRGKPYSCLGELCWYLAKTNDLEFIFYYIPAYKKFADGDQIFGGYGPRLFNWDGLNQVSTITELLRKNPHSRKAVIQLFDAQDILEEHKDVPCTCIVQVMIRRDKLHMMVTMRSNDVIWGLPHDIFCFTMLQEILARDLSVEVGTYKHAVGSLHIYDKTMDTARKFIDEGWQPTAAVMPPMPLGSPWSSIEVLLSAASAIRSNGTFDSVDLRGLDPYWMDLVRLLQVFHFKKNKNSDGVKVLRAKMSSSTYFQFIDSLIEQLS
ncbi:MAG: thymidylate synthase [Acidobacteria bacterium]|nr:thymidylate synthase [Acidobacteriota bacterium]